MLKNILSAIEKPELYEKTKAALIEEARKNGFKICSIFGDVAGRAYSNDSETIAILLEK